MKSFREICKKELPFEGDKVAMDKVLDKPIFIYAWRISKSKIANFAGDNYMMMQFSFADDETAEKHVLMTSSEVLMKQAKECGEQEFSTTISKINTYYSFT